MKDKFKRFDDKFLDLINKRMQTRYLDVFMFRVTDLGGAIFSSLILLLFFALGNNNIKLIGFEAFIALAISQAFAHSLKRVLSRERPYKIIEQLNTYGIDLNDYSFPSGHTTASFSIATTIAINIPRLSLLVFILAMVVGISRIYLGVHYPTDVAVGILLGFTVALFIHFYLLDLVYKLARAIGYSI